MAEKKTPEPVFAHTEEGGYVLDALEKLPKSVRIHADRIAQALLDADMLCTDDVLDYEVPGATGAAVSEELIAPGVLVERNAAGSILRVILDRP